MIERDYDQYMNRAKLEKTVNTLVGILDGIHADDKITAAEIDEIQSWCIMQQPYKNLHPFKEILPVIESSLIDGVLTNDEILDIRFVVNNFINESPYYDLVTQDIQKLHGILHGILSDNEINDDEINYLRNWLIDNDHLESTYPYDELYAVLHSVLKDGVIDDREKKMLMAFFSDFMDTGISANINSEEMKKIKSEMTVNGICALAPNIEFEGKTFCFTGESSKYKRSEIADMIISKGSKFNKNVVSTTDYLVVGDEGNKCWAFACYGRKIEEAMKLRKQGKQLVIVHEIDFWDAMND